MVYDSERSIAAPLVAVVCLCRRVGLANTQQMVFHFPRGLQRGDILVPRAVQGIDHCVQSYSLRGFVDRRIKKGIQQSLALDAQNAAACGSALSFDYSLFTKTAPQGQPPNSSLCKETRPAGNQGLQYIIVRNRQNLGNRE